VTAENKLNNAA